MHVEPNVETVQTEYDSSHSRWQPATHFRTGETLAHPSRGPGNANGLTINDCWSNSAGKRIFDFSLACAGLVALSPLIAATAIAVKLSSEGPILFRQIRMGSHGRTFTILKFRTMRSGLAASGPSVTKAGDRRLTRIGSFLRKSKLDEFPQLINVLRGDMSLIGPRPKVPHHQTTILHFRPGITGAASIAFRDEEQVLHRIPEKHLDDYQVHVLMPMKTELDEAYMRKATPISDIRMLFRTVFGGKPAEDEETSAQHSLLLLRSALDRAVSANKQEDKRARYAVDRAAS